MPAPAPQQARDIFLEALEGHRPDDWPEFIAAASGGDEALRAEVQRLLDAHGQLDSFMAHPALGPATTMRIPDVPAGELIGTMIGRYKLMEQIGEGGMGVVYVAEQREPIRRQVALKVIKPGMDSRQVVARFEAERQALAMMEHPHIARVLDGGSTDEGRPYFVMELVRGVPITEFCDAAQFPIQQRLELFVQVCQAVQHAHQKGIIHRDIKPNNVLVARHDATPVPKVIDFGVAKAVNQSLTEQTVYTQFAQMIGTPLYMSPEQAELSGLDVDTRSDVYSLGVLLYELLTGTTPFDAETLREQGLDELRRVIREEEPAQPSQRISTLNAEAGSTISDRRGVDVYALRQLLGGELDWIVMRALEKDRTRRYQSASDLAADIQRFLGDEPVEASPPSAWYRFRKLASRNLTLLLAAVVVATALLVGTGVSLWQAVEANLARADTEAEKQRAEASFQKARATVKKLLAEVADKDVIGVPGMRQLYLRLLDDAAQAYSELIAMNPHDADLHIDRGDVLRLKGDRQGAEVEFQRALSLDPHNVRAHVNQARCLYGTGFDDPDEKWERALIHITRAIELKPADQELKARRARVLIALKRRNEALLELRSIGANASLDAPASHQTAEALWTLGNNAEALPHIRRAVELNPREDFSQMLLGSILGNLGRYDESLAAFSESIRLNPRPSDPSRTRYPFELRANTYLDMKKYKEALADLDRHMEIAPTVYHVYKRRAQAHFHLKHYEAAFADLSQALTLRPDDGSTITWLGVETMDNCPDEACHEAMLIWATKWIELTKAEGSVPSSYHFYKRRAVAHYRLKHYPEALADVGQVMKLEPSYWSKPFFMEEIVAKDDSFRRSVLDLLARTLAATPEHESQAIKRRLVVAIDGEAKLLTAAGDWDGALQYIQQIIELEPRGLWQTKSAPWIEDNAPAAVRGRFHELCRPLDAEAGKWKSLWQQRHAELGAAQPATREALIACGELVNPRSTAAQEPFRALYEELRASDPGSVKIQPAYLRLLDSFEAGSAERLKTAEECYRWYAAREPSDLNQLMTKEALANEYFEQGRFAEAIQHRREVVAAVDGLSAKLLMNRDKMSISTRQRLGILYAWAGRFDDAWEVWREIDRRLATPNIETTLSMYLDRHLTKTELRSSALAGQAFTYLQAQRLEEAEAAYVKAIESARAAYGDMHLETANPLRRLGRVLLERGRPAEAEPLLRECLATRTQLAPFDYRKFDTMSLLGESLARQSKTEEAEALLRDGFAGMEERSAKISPFLRRERLGDAAERLVNFYAATQKPEQEQHWQSRLAEVHAKYPPATAASMQSAGK